MPLMSSTNESFLKEFFYVEDDIEKYRLHLQHFCFDLAAVRKERLLAV